jgi:predicted unusual protein kinase regulating ubiquinone biosynthesis (AarF/ABC1/UbiB family)
MVQYLYWYKFKVLDEKLKNIEFQIKFRKDITLSGIITTKIGQWLSHRSDVLSPELIRALKPLVNSVPNTHSYDYTAKIVDECFLYCKVFEYISKDILGSGSISQVYVCKVKKLNHLSVLKIHHKNIQHNFKKERAYWKNALWVLRLFKIDFAINLDEFIDVIEEQLSYKKEYNNYAQIKTVLNDIDFIKIPSITHVYSKIIVMTYEKGFTYAEISELYPEYLIDMSQKLMIAYFFMVYNGCVHCDLHDGNALYRID